DDLPNALALRPSREDPGARADPAVSLPASLDHARAHGARGLRRQGRDALPEAAGRRDRLDQGILPGAPGAAARDAGRRSGRLGAGMSARLRQGLALARDWLAPRAGSRPWEHTVEL